MTEVRFLVPAASPATAASPASAGRESRDWREYQARRSVHRQEPAEARRIRTLDISELPDQDCCTLLTPRRVETRARIDDLRRIEIRLDAGDLAEELAASAREYRHETP